MYTMYTHGERGGELVQMSSIVKSCQGCQSNENHDNRIDSDHFSMLFDLFSGPVSDKKCYVNCV